MTPLPNSVFNGKPNARNQRLADRLAAALIVPAGRLRLNVLAIILALPVGGCLAALSVPTAADGATTNQYAINIEPSYFGGQFGTSNTISVYEVPITVEYHGKRLRLRAEVPFVVVSGSGLISGGSVIQTNGHSIWRTGLGDIWVGADYRVLDGAGVQPSVKPYIKVKIPTASRSKGLGTGQPDIEFGSHFQWNLYGKLIPYARIGYRVVGKAPGLRLQNVLTYEAGVTWILPHHAYMTALFLDGGAIQSGTGSTEELIAAYTIQINAALEFQTYLTRGLTSNSPAFGGGMGITRRF